jgi:hypothetical protein
MSSGNRFDQAILAHVEFQQGFISTSAERLAIQWRVVELE